MFGISLLLNNRVFIKYLLLYTAIPSFERCQISWWYIHQGFLHSLGALCIHQTLLFLPKLASIGNYFPDESQAISKNDRISAYLPIFYEVRQHYNRHTLSLIYHFPHIPHSGFHGALSNNVCPFQLVSLHRLAWEYDLEKSNLHQPSQHVCSQDILQ